MSVNFAVATPSFLEELITTLSAHLMTDEDLIEDDNECSRSVLMSDIQVATLKFLQLTKFDETQIPATCKQQINILSILAKPGTTFTSARDVIYERYGVELSSFLSNINKIELSYLRDLFSRLQLKIEYLRLKPTLDYLAEVLHNSSNIKELVTFVKDAARDILTTVSYRKMFDKFDTQNADVVKLINEYEYILNPRNYISTGYPALDSALYGGFAKTRLYVIAGPSGSGKSTYLLNFLWRALQWHSHKQFIYVTLENIVPETLLRLACINEQRNVLANAMESKAVLKEELVGSLNNVTKKFSQRENRVQVLYYDSSTTIDTIINDLRSAAQEKPDLAAIYYDYLNVMAVTKEDKRAFLGEVTRRLKDLAVELQVPVITAAQLNRAAYDLDTGRQLSLSQMGEAMLIVENSDVVLLTANESKNRNPDAKKDEQFAALKIGKSRYAKEKLFTVTYNRETYTVLNMQDYMF